MAATTRPPPNAAVSSSVEYRGYDSAGVAVITASGELERVRAAGKLARLQEALIRTPVVGRAGIAHTRWATHGRPTEENAHPHRDCTGRVVVIHNGIIENYLELKYELQAKGHAFVTETDTEVVAHALEQVMKDDGADLVTAFRTVLPRLRGIYALVAISTEAPDALVAARLGPPLVVGIGRNEWFVASDIPAILMHTKDVVFMDDHEIVVIDRSGARFARLDGLSAQCLSEYMHVTTRPRRQLYTMAEAFHQVEELVIAYPVFDLTPLVVLEAARGVPRSRAGLLRCPDLGSRPPEPGDGRFQRGFPRSAGVGRRALRKPVHGRFPPGGLGLS